MVNLLILLVGIAANAAASILIKFAVMPPAPALELSRPMCFVTSVPLLAGVGVYGLAFVLYVLALQRLPLHVAHPVLTCGAVAAVALCSALVF